MQILSNPISALNVRKSPKFSRSLGNRGNTMVTSDFRPEVEIWPFCACAIKNTQYNANLWPIRLNFRVLKEIGHNYRNSSFIVDVAMGQIPRSTECIASYEWNSTTLHATINVCSQRICCVWQESTQHPPWETWTHPHSTCCMVSHTGVSDWDTEIALTVKVKEKRRQNLEFVDSRKISYVRCSDM